MVAPSVMPGRAFQRVDRISRLLFHWTARDLSLTPRTGQALTLTRASDGSAIDSRGRSRDLVHSQPRFEFVDLDGDGIRETPSLVLEGSRINKAQRQSELSNAFWTKGGVTLSNNIAQGANGTVIADKLVEDSASTLHGISRAFTFTAGDKMVVSAVVESAGRPDIRMLFRSDAEVNGFRGRFNLLTGVYTPDTAQGTGSLIGGGVIPLRSGKYRVWLSGTVDPAATTAIWRLLGNNPSGTDTYLGDGASGQIVSDIQCEVGQFPSSIIVNDGDTDVTRSADACSASFNWGPNRNLSALLHIVRPLWTDLPGDVGIGTQTILNLGTGTGSVDCGGRSGVREFYARTGVTNLASLAFPAGSSLLLLAQWKNLQTSPQSAVDVGSGLSGFHTPNTPFAAYGNQVLTLGAFFENLISVKIAGGLFTANDLIGMA